jgi:hypothetical protein
MVAHTERLRDIRFSILDNELSQACSSAGEISPNIVKENDVTSDWDPANRKERIQRKRGLDHFKKYRFRVRDM